MKDDSYKLLLLQLIVKVFCMELMINDTNLRMASRKDRKIVQKVRAESFKNDPCILWLTEQAKRKDKVEVIVDYMIDETFEDGTIFITKDNSAVALWKTGKKEKFTWRFIKRNLSFLFKMGISCVVRNLKNKADIVRHFPRKEKYCYLYSIGVVPASQGNGLASMLMNPVIDFCKGLNVPLLLETANTRNVEIYKKKGFVITDASNHDSTTIFYMRN
jgi:GNAT superfamily N-acetyltransferase